MTSQYARGSGQNSEKEGPSRQGCEREPKCPGEKPWQTHAVHQARCISSKAVPKAAFRRSSLRPGSCTARSSSILWRTGNRALWRAARLRRKAPMRVVRESL